MKHRETWLPYHVQVQGCIMFGQREDSSSYHVRFGLLVFVEKALILW